MGMKDTFSDYMMVSQVKCERKEKAPDLNEGEKMRLRAFFGRAYLANSIYLKRSVKKSEHGLSFLWCSRGKKSADQAVKKSDLSGDDAPKWSEPANDVHPDRHGITLGRHAQPHDLKLSVTETT